MYLWNSFCTFPTIFWTSSAVSWLCNVIVNVVWFWEVHHLRQQFDCLLNVVDPDEVVLVKVVDLEGVVQLRLSWCSLAQGGEEKEELVETFSTLSFHPAQHPVAWLSLNVNC